MKHLTQGGNTTLGNDLRFLSDLLLEKSDIIHKGIGFMIVDRLKYAQNETKFVVGAILENCLETPITGVVQ